MRKDVGTEKLEKCFDKVLKNAALLGSDLEQDIERVKKLYKSEEQRKVVKKPKSRKSKAKE